MKKKITNLKTVLLLLTLSFIISASSIAQTLEAHYEFTNNLNDATANARNLTKTGLAASFTADKDANANSAFDANDATGQYLTATGYKGIGGNGARTVAAWINLRAGSNRRTIVSWGTNSSEKMFNVMIEGGKIRVEAGSSNIKSASTAPNGTWTHIAVTYDPTDGATLADCKMYINGTLTAEGSTFNGTRIIDTDIATNDLRIGEAIYGTGHFFRGEMDDVRIYSGALTGSAIATLAGITATAPVTNFSASSTTPSTDDIITFTDTSTNTPTTWSWDFGAADAVGNKTDQNPQVSYPTAGTYTVTLTASNAGGSDDEVKTNYITVSGSGGSGDLQAQYNFDNNINDASTYGRNLSATGSFTPTYENNFKASTSSALTASGTYADHLITGYSGVGGANNRSISSWFKTTGTNREPLVSYGENSGGEMFNVMIDNGVPRVEAGASSLKTTDSGLNDDNWHHIVVTYDAADGTFLSNVKIYIDGVLSTNETDAGASFASETTTINTNITSNFLKVGSSVYATYTFDGAIDDVRIYSKVLTAAEVKEVATNIYNTASGSWGTAGNWSYGTVPIASENAFIPSGNTVTIASTTGAIVNNLDIAGTLNISSAGSLIVSGTATGNVTYNVGVNDTDWHLISSPVVGEQYNDDNALVDWVSVNNIATGTNSNVGIGTYDNGTPDTNTGGGDTATGHWRYFQAGGAATDFDSGKGYQMKRSSGTNYGFTGTYKTDDLVMTIDQDVNNWNLIGNPYPTYLLVSEIIGDNTTNLTDSHAFIYVWNNAKTGGAGYETLDGGDYIHPGQAFFVNAKNSTANNFTITESRQKGFQTGTLYKTSNLIGVKLFVKNSKGMQKFTDVEYTSNATTSLDKGLDAGTFTGVSSDFSIYSHLIENSKGINFMKQALPNSDLESMVVPVGVKSDAGEITFSAEALNLPTGIKVFLEDRVNNTFTRLDEVNAVYKTNVAAGSTDGRFFLHTRTSSVLNIDSVILDGVSIYTTNSSNLRITGLQKGKTSVSLFNILGKRIMNTSFSATNVNNIELPKLAKGIYFVKLESVNGKLNKKIILK